MNFTPRHTFLLTLCTAVLLVGASQITPGQGAFLGIHKVDIFSELRSDSALCKTAGYETNEIVDNITYASISDTITTNSTDGKKPAVISAPNQKPKVKSSIAPKAIVAVNDSAMAATKEVVETNVKSKKSTQPKNITVIEDFSDDGSLNTFINKLRTAKNMGRPIRIAVLGDSFIEGDIFTQDLRELLQSRFGGKGVGFVPIASGVAGFRQTVKHSFAGWNTHCITSNLKRGGYTISSYTFTPGDGSTVIYKGSNARAYLDHFSRVRLMFVNKGNTRIRAVINSETEQVFNPSSGPQMQQVVLFGDTIRSVKFTVENTDGFTGYGTFLDDTKGVCVDNYSVRGNSGVTLISTDTELTKQMNAIVPYDLIIFEYGLNVAQADVKSYNTYLMQMQSAIAHLKQSFPSTAILVMSVPDRARRTADGFITMPGIAAMANVQRELAQKTGSSFWSTLDAMKAKGGMGEFVKRGWAAKDYTHLSHRGGKEMARAFYDALILKIDGSAQ